TVTIPSVLMLQIPVTEIAETSSAVQGLVARNGNPTAALTITLATSDASELAVPATVTIPAGKSSMTFSLTPQQDGVPDRNKLVTVTASASNYLSGAVTITVRNSDAPQLTLQFAAGSVVEGSQVVCTAWRNGPTDSAVQVHLNPVGHNRLIFPEFV